MCAYFAHDATVKTFGLCLQLLMFLQFAQLVTPHPGNVLHICNLNEANVDQKQVNPRCVRALYCSFTTSCGHCTCRTGLGGILPLFPAPPPPLLPKTPLNPFDISPGQGKAWVHHEPLQSRLLLSSGGIPSA